MRKGEHGQQIGNSGYLPLGTRVPLNHLGRVKGVDFPALNEGEAHLQKPLNFGQPTHAHSNRISPPILYADILYFGMICKK